MTNIPEDLRYTKEDEWIRVEDNELLVGITDFAQDSLSDIVYLELPAVGEQVTAGETFGVVESVKAAADLYAPVAGEITAVNDDLADTPEKLNEDPYGDAWLIRLRADDMSDLDELMDAGAYRSYVEQRS